MRKNGINRELRPIAGGVCAPEGYTANAVSCGIREDGGLDFAMIYSPKRCSVACVFASGKMQGAPVKISRQNMRSGYARAILVNGGVANVFGEEGEDLALGVCDLLFARAIERTEIIVCSTGKIGAPIYLSSFEGAIDVLWQGLSSSETQSAKVARAIKPEGGEEKHLAYEFDLGDYPCKIGVVFKGGGQISPNMATLLAFLTTDVNISSPMLQKALNAAVRDTLNTLSVDGITSPNDTVTIFANGKAGNYKIDCPDSEYKKFADALRAVLSEVTLAVAREGKKRLLTCRVKGGISKEACRSAAKAVVCSAAVKRGLKEGVIHLENVVFAVLSAVGEGEELSMEAKLCSSSGEIAFYDGGRRIPFSRESVKEFLAEGDIEIFVDLRRGNFQARAVGRLDE